MNFWGKLIGFFLGYLVLGPFGGVLGVIAGSFFDRGLRLHLHTIPRHHAPDVQQAFFKATFSVMGHLAKADGHVRTSEIRVAEQIMARLELGYELRQEAMRLFNVGKQPAFALEDTLDTLFQYCSRHRDLLRFFIEIQLEAALADGELRAEEERILLIICKRLHVSSLEFEQLWARQWASQGFHQWYSEFAEGGPRTRSYSENTRRRYSHQGGFGAKTPPTQNSLAGAYGVLGVAASATVAEIKKAYRKLMNQHHPDKLVARGLPENMVNLAKEKTQQIRAAYDLIREARGFR